LVGELCDVIVCYAGIVEDLTAWTLKDRRNIMPVVSLATSRAGGMHYYITIVIINYYFPSVLFLQCFDAVDWAAGRASGLLKAEWWGAGVVICLEQGADLHMAQLMPLPFTVSCFSKIQIGFYRAMLCIRGTSDGPVSVSPSVRPSVRPSEIGVLLKRLNVGSHKQHRTIAQEL